MAKYRPIFTKIWNDPDFEEYTSHQKLIFFYLCTNPLTTESGIYPISCRTISQNTGIELSEVKDTMINNKIKNVLYDPVNKVVFVCNFLRYNGRGRPDLVVKSIYNDYINIKTPLWDEFRKRYPRYFEESLRLSKDLDKCAIPNPIPNPNPTPYSTDGESENVEMETDKIPVREMMSMFVEHWKKHNEGHYTSNYQKEEKVAGRLWQQCLKDYPQDPLKVFRRKVERLYKKHNIKFFSGLEKFWNLAAGEKKNRSNWVRWKGD